MQFDAERKLLDVLAGICAEDHRDFRVNAAGELQFIRRVASYRSADIIQAVSDADILNDVYRFLTDPDDVAANRLLVRYEDSGGNSQSATFDNAAAQTQERHRRPAWSASSTCARPTTWRRGPTPGSPLLAFPPRYLEMRLKTDRLLPGDTLSVSIDEKYVRAEPFQVRSVTRDPISDQSLVTCWHLADIIPGVWTSDTAPTWANASASEKQVSGFWLDGDGLAPGQTAGTPHVSVWV